MAEISDTDKRLDKNDKEHIAIMEKLDAFKDFFNDKINSLQVDIARMPDKILERADDRYASKTAEKVIYALVGAVCLAFIMGLWEILKTS